jgi:hypothetical protein
VLTETCRDGDVASPDYDFHLDPPSSLILPNPLELDPIEQCLREVGGTRPADLVFDPTFAC